MLPPRRSLCCLWEQGVSSLGDSRGHCVDHTPVQRPSTIIPGGIGKGSMRPPKRGRRRAMMLQREVLRTK